MMQREQVINLLKESGRKIKPNLLIFQDTSDFMNLEAGDVILLEDMPYLISRNEKEFGYGQDDDPKYWVKRTTNLETGETKIIKLVFFEELQQNIGGYNIRFFRSPEKEAAMLDLVKNNPHFMHGTWTSDLAGNNVRVIDYISGHSLVQIVAQLDCSHEKYFRQELIRLFPSLLNCLAALSFLHANNMVHGDVHWNHILWDREAKLFRWIDFDYAYYFPENPFSVDLFGIGKVLANAIGQGPKFYHDLKRESEFGKIVGNLVAEDFSIIEGTQLMNLKKIYPYIPDSLNNILMHFSGHSEAFYQSVDEIIHDLRKALREIC